MHFGHNKAFGEEKEDRYKAALQRFLDEWANHEISARARFRTSEPPQQRRQTSGSPSVGQAGARTFFPNSVGGPDVLQSGPGDPAKSADISTERVWNEPLPSIRVNYRNVTKVFFRVVPYNFEDFIAAQQWRMASLDQEQRQKLLAVKPALAWAADLPPTTDFKERLEKLPAPKNLKPGCYFLLASHDPSFGEKNNRVSVAAVWVSDLALVMRTRNSAGVPEGFVLNANTGEPVAGATVRGWVRNRSTGRFEPLEPTKSDDNGLFRFSRQEQACIFLAEQGEQRLSTSHEYSTGMSPREPARHPDRLFYRSLALSAGSDDSLQGNLPLRQSSRGPIQDDLRPGVDRAVA